MRPAIVRISLRALRHNLGKARTAAPQSQVIAVVKANAYGHGLTRVVPALGAADACGVACSEEALMLREAGWRKPILLLEGVFEPSEWELCARHGLWAVVHHVSQIEMLERHPPSQPIPVWLKIDTGMRRLGFPAEDAGAIWRRLRECRAVEPNIRLMSHFANADDCQDPTSLRQIDAWRTATAGLAGEVSFANSAGVLGWPAAHFDWIRPGIMLYGVSPFTDTTGADEGLRPVMTLTTRLIAVKPLRKGDRVGYSGTWEAPQDMRLGIAAIGYGDGYPRHAQSGTPVLVGGQAASIVGRVSMDMICIDLRDCPNAQVGDPVTLWGEDLPVETIAKRADTIAYELLCGITQRVHVRVQE
ncbi:MAG: alanine racemase [Gammaproteobacteria bacterium]